MSKFVTIVTATFNASEQLQILANSIRAQTSQEFDWIIVDGGSADSTVSIAMKNSDIVTKFISGPDFGIYDALNKAILKVSTPYYLVVGADDVLNPMAVELYTKYAKSCNADIISANVLTTNNEILRPGRGQAWRFGHLAYVSQHSIGSLIKTSTHNIVGMYSKFYPIAADRFFLCKAIEIHKCIVAPANFVAGIYSCKGLSSVRTYEATLDIYKVDYALSNHPFYTAIFCLVRYMISLRKF